MKILAIPVPRENVKNVGILPLHERNIGSGPPIEGNAIDSESRAGNKPTPSPRPG